MRPFAKTQAAGLLVLIIALTCSCAQKEGLSLSAGPPPATEVALVVDTLHGEIIEDPYRWLEDQENPAVRDWIGAQNEYTQSALSSLPGREELRRRIEELMRLDRISAPTERSGKYFLYKRDADQDLYVIYTRDSLHGQDEVLIDPHTMSEDHSVSVGLWGASEDASLVAYSVRQGGADQVEIRFKVVRTCEDLPDVLPTGRYYGFDMLRDKSGCYYCRHTDEGPRVYYHRMGSAPEDDQLLFGEGYGTEVGVGVSLSNDDKWLMLHVWHGSSGEQTEVYYQNVARKGPIKALVNDIEAKFWGEVAEDTYYFQTNWDAPNWRIMKVDMNNPSRENWEEIIPESEAVMEGFSLAGGKVFVNYLHNVKSEVKAYDPNGTLLCDIAMPTIGSVGSASGRWDSDEAFYTFTSFHFPTTIYRYNIATGEQEVFDKLDVPVDTDNIEVKQVWYESKDGTKVPMFLAHKKGLKLDGQRPTYLTGYGGFNASMTPYFSSTAVLWIEKDGVFATPNLRGGGEFGEEWHRAAMFEKKQNTFDDFIAAAEWLIANKYTSPSKVAIAGGSNGGLLVGAAMTQRPDLFGTVLCTYPLLDMLRYHKFLVGQFWVSEYGSADDPEAFEYIYDYSPYHRVRENTEYPAVLFVTGDADTRVDPCHARKMTALMQTLDESDRPVMLHYRTKAGHSGGTPMSIQIEDQLAKVSFLLWQLGEPLN